MNVASAASQADPYPSSLVIGGILGLLQISDNYDNFQLLISKWLSKLSAKASVLIEFDLCIYQYDEEIQDALVLVYGDILDFCQKALKLYVDEEGKRRSGFRLLGKSLIERFSDSFGQITDNFDAHLEQYRTRASLCDSRRLLQIFWVVAKSALEQRQNHVAIIDSLRDGRSEIQTQFLQSHQQQLSIAQEQREANRAHRQAHEEILDRVLAGMTEAQAQEDQRAAERERVREEQERVRTGSCH